MWTCSEGEGMARRCVLIGCWLSQVLPHPQFWWEELNKKKPYEIPSLHPRSA